MFKIKYVQICYCGSEIEAGAVVSVLQANGFNPAEIRRSSYLQIIGMYTSFYVEVPENEVDQAIVVLKDLNVRGILSDSTSH